MNEKAISKFKMPMIPIIGKKIIDFISNAYKILKNLGLLVYAYTFYYNFDSSFNF